MKKLLISLLVLTISATTIQAKRTKVKFTDYKVQSGDTLFLIARKHHTTTEEVRNTNKLEKDQLIRVGQELRVPTDTYFPKNRVTSKKTPKKGMTEYTIEAGDTLFTIARKHHTTTKEVLEANEMERGAMIRIGQSLKVPTNTYFPDKEKKKPVKIVKKAPKKGIADYVIKSGDTIFTIARKHHTTTKELRDANGMKRNSIIRVGKKLKVPTNTYFPDGVKTVEKTKIVKKEKAKEIYEVKSGDTLFSIARKHHVTLKTIMALNNMKAGGIIKIGQKLKVSKKVSYVTKKKKVKKVKYVTKKYKVKRGDTLSRIAKRYKISVKELRRLNKLSRKSSLRIGKVLAVGKSPIKIKKTKRTYKVRRGDTLWLIAKKHKTTVKKLRKLNKLSRRSKLYKGMVLAVDGKIKKSKTKQYIAKKKTSKKTTKRTKYASKSKSKSSKKRLSEAMAILNGKRSSKSRSSGSNSKVIRTAKRYLGTRYVWGAQGPNRFDCSGFTQYVIRKSKGVRLPRVSRKQAYYGKYVSRQNLRAGDLVFFDTSRRRRGYVNHVGIYIGGNKFIHASSAKHRVVITSLNRPFYRSRFKWGRRVN
ncbi:MAG TPA: peptidoglycan endopeptidase [Sulfurovum sp.]|nr:peptidoglycan endopeptidase [Sulfurovum sp.]